jgi:hypothetical protein
VEVGRNLVLGQHDGERAYLLRGGLVDDHPHAQLVAAGAAAKSSMELSKAIRPAFGSELLQRLLYLLRALFLAEKGD